MHRREYNVSKKDLKIPKQAIRNRKPKKDRQHNGQKKKDKITTNDVHNLQCPVLLYLQLFVGGRMSYLRCLYLFAYSGVQRILFCVLFSFSSSCVYYVANVASLSGLSLWYSLTFIYTENQRLSNTNPTATGGERMCYVCHYACQWYFVSTYTWKFKVSIQINEHSNQQ